jgi:hypothetical protein
MYQAGVHLFRLSVFRERNSGKSLPEIFGNHLILSLSGAFSCNADTLDVGTETGNHHSVLRYAVLF